MKMTNAASDAWTCSSGGLGQSKATKPIRPFGRTVPLTNAGAYTGSDAGGGTRAAFGPMASGTGCPACRARRT